MKKLKRPQKTIYKEQGRHILKIIKFTDTGTKKVVSKLPIVPVLIR